MSRRRRFRLLLQIFQDRFFENDTVSTGGGFQTNIHQVLGFLMATGFFVAYFLTPMMLELSVRKAGPDTEWALRSIRLFLPACSFAVIGFATVFEWDMLFPDRRDFLILGPFPIRLWELWAAKFTALCRFLLLLTASLNLFPTLMVVVFCTVMPELRETGLRLLLAHIASTAGSSAFAFFAVGAFQGLLIQITTARVFRRISPWIQMLGMSLMVLSLLSFPIYLMLLRPAAAAKQLWLWFFPPIWFTGLYDLLLGGDALFASLGRFALELLGFAIATYALGYAFGFRRHYRRTLEADASPPHKRLRSRFASLIRSPQEHAIFEFSGKTLARSTKHQMFLWL